MRVSDLLAVLSGVDPSLDVLAHAQHGECRFQFFDIQSAEQARASRSRDEEGQPHVALNDDGGRPLLVLTLTSEF